MREVEVKILEINVREMHEKLVRLGAHKVEEGLMHERAYDFPGRRIKKRNDLFRIRKYGGRTEIAYKAGLKSNSFLIHDEHQTHVDDFDTICKIVELLGLTIVKDREKKRESYVLGNVKFEIDKYPTIPTYLEIEGIKAGIKDALRKLGYTMKDTTNMTSTKVLKHYKQDPDYQKF